MEEEEKDGFMGSGFSGSDDDADVPLDDDLDLEMDGMHFTDEDDEKTKDDEFH